MGKILFFILFVFGLISSSFAEDITITTYYPSPYGSYNSLQADRIGVGDNNASGSLTSADVPTTSGHMWVRGNVGIGTTNPLSRLSVGGSGNSNYAISATGRSTGVYASGTSTGVYGSGDSYGLYGYSRNNTGVYGKGGDHDISGCTGIYGEGNIGVLGNATDYHLDSKGVYGIGNSYGVMGESDNGFGVWGWSDRGEGIHGVSLRSVGIYGEGRTYAIQGVGGNYGVVGSGSAAAFRAISGGYQFSDNTIQTTAATASGSPACRLCGEDGCESPYSKEVATFKLGNNNDMWIFSDCNNTDLNAEPDLKRHNASLCCR